VEITKIINSLKDEEFAVFCGAGISYNSGLPLANELKRYILKQLPINDEDIDEIMNSKLPFEAFIGKLSKNNGNIGISKILDIFGNGEPNDNHIFIAKLVKLGYLKTILITNFDLLIEKALEKEGLKENIDFVKYYKEKQFPEVDFDDVYDKTRIFKIHGSIDDRDSIRTTMESIENKSLSEKRMKVIKHLFSTGKHKKVLILGYSCSDIFDITPQIQSIGKDKKEIIFIEHCEEKIEENSDIRIREKINDNENPFKKFQGKWKKCDTDDLIEKLWTSFKDIFGEYKSIKSETEWKTYIDDWIKELEKTKGLNYFISGSTLSDISSYKKAIDYYGKSLEILKEERDKAGIATCYVGLGNAYSNMGYFNKAIECHEKATEIFKERKNKKEESTCYNNLGKAYHESGDLDKATEYYTKALDIFKEIGDKLSESTVYMNLGSIRGEIGDFNEAIRYHKKSLGIYIRIGNNSGKSTCYLNLGNAYCGLRKFDEAIRYYKKSLEIKKKIGDRKGESKCCMGLGNAYHGLGDFKKAIEFHENSLEISNEIENKIEESGCYINLGLDYYNLEDYTRAIEYCLKAEKILKETKQIHHLKILYGNLSLAYEKLGDKTNAEKYKTKCDEIKNQKMKVLLVGNPNV